ncbi:MAG: fibronectin type III domain-containing protein [Jatrophihabitans sp.]|uniref:fibronectin type III domain-containing protein n=1 Tax=Jatrophihabitans sp. TaxID=1932789 RepID=UPI003F820C9A
MTRLTPLACGTAAGLAATFLLAVAPNASAAQPPYEPDPGAVGTITFYDSTGNIITSGSTTTAPMAAYAVGSVAGRSGDHTTLLKMAQPNPASVPGLWNVDTLGSATDYPLASGPAPVTALSQSHPVSAGLNTDLTVDDFISEFPNDPAHDSNTAYQNLYQVRLVTANGANQNNQYDVADILVSGTTWTQVYPAPATVPDAPTNVHATAGNQSATVSWSAPSQVATGYDVQYSTDGGSTWTTNTSFEGNAATTEKITGLANGTAYVFRVAAIDGAGTGAYSTASSPVTPTADATAVSIAAPTAVRFGTTVTVTGSVRDTTTNTALAGASVKLVRRSSPNAPWTLVRTVTSGPAGGVSAAYKPTTNVQFQWQYAATATHRAAASAVRTVSVAQTVSIAAKPASVRHGGTLKIYGVVTPAGGGSVSLQRLFGTTWKTVATATLKRQKLPNGVTTVGYVVAVKLPTKGSYRYRVTRAKTATLAAGTSAVVTVKAT